MSKILKKKNNLLQNAQSLPELFQKSFCSLSPHTQRSNVFSSCEWSKQWLGANDRVQNFLRKPCTFYPTITTNEKEENWTALEHFMISKNFVNFIVTLLNKEESEDVKIAMEGLSLQAGSFHVCSYYILFTRMALRRCQKNSNHSQQNKTQTVCLFSKVSWE